MANTGVRKAREKVKKKKNRFMSLLITLATLSFLCYAVTTLISNQVEISQRKQSLRDIQSQKIVQQQENDELERLLTAEDDGEYIERIAREKLGYAYYDERVYYAVPAN